MTGSMHDGGQRILKAAERLFSDHGYDATSIQRVANAAEVSKATVFHHFGSKQELYLAVVREACREIHEASMAHGDESADQLAQLHHFAAAHLDHLFERESLSRVVFRSLLDNSQETGRDMAEKVFSDQFSNLVELIGAGQQAGIINPDVDSAHAAIAVVGMNTMIFQSWSVLRHLPGNHFTDYRDSGNKLFDIVLTGLMAKQGDKA